VFSEFLLLCHENQTSLIHPPLHVLQDAALFCRLLNESTHCRGAVGQIVVFPSTLIEMQWKVVWLL